MSKSEIMKLLDHFISGADTSLELANRIEVFLDDTYPDDDFLQESVEMLACYRPDGGAEVLGTDTLVRRLSATKEYLGRKYDLE